MYFNMNVRGNWTQKILVHDSDAEDARCHDTLTLYDDGEDMTCYVKVFRVKSIEHPIKYSGKILTTFRKIGEDKRGNFLLFRNKILLFVGKEKNKVGC